MVDLDQHDVDGEQVKVTLNDLSDILVEVVAMAVARSIGVRWLALVEWVVLTLIFRWTLAQEIGRAHV